jgi:hypothetical protein
MARPDTTSPSLTEDAKIDVLPVNSREDEMTQAESAVMAAALAAVVALAGAVLAAVVALRNETSRRRAAQLEADRQATKAQAAEVFRHMFALQHEMEWLTWHAAQRPIAINSRMVTSYESAVHIGYPSLLGSMATLASLDLDLYSRLLPIVERIYDVEGQIGRIITGLDVRRQRPRSVQELGELNGSVKAMYLDLPPQLASAMRGAE